MFARTSRLLLRPGWAEDAAALASAIADEAIVRNLATAPWPYGLADAQAFLAAGQNDHLPRFLLFARTDGAPVLVGACGLSAHPSGSIELGYWIARAHWGQGFATEAARQLVEIANALGLARLDAHFFLDNPQSGRVLEKLGFLPTGITTPRNSCARGGEAPARQCRLMLRQNEVGLAA